MPSGTGELNADYVLNQLPAMLSLDEKKTKPIVKEIIGSRKRMLLVQAVSQYRQKRPAEAVVSLQNLLSCTRALPEKEAMQWSEKAELRDIFQAYCNQVREATREAALVSALAGGRSTARMVFYVTGTSCHTPHRLILCCVWYRRRSAPSGWQYKRSWA